MSWKCPPVDESASPCPVGSLSWIHPSLDSNGPDEASTHGSHRQTFKHWMNPPVGSERSSGANLEASESSWNWMSPCADSELELESNEQLAEPMEKKARATSASRAVLTNDNLDQVHLHLAPLILLHGANSNSSTSPHLTTYDRNSRCPARIKRVVHAGCHCRFKCMNNLVAHLADVILFCELFFGISVSARSHFLISCREHNRASDLGLQNRTAWHMFGHRISVTCLSVLLGTCVTTLYKHAAGRIDRRTKEFSSRERLRPSSAIVNQFFVETYWGAAEDLPETELALADNDDHEDAVAGAHRITNPFDSFARAEWNPSCIAEDLINAASSDKLPVRHLQHGKLMDLFWQFLAWFEVLKDIAAHQYRCPSWSTFCHEWHCRWHKSLRFRKRTQHTMQLLLQMQAIFEECKRDFRRKESSSP